ncbi:DEAD/DEAH box helicase [Parafrankia discariae]|uniref:DEAD/DEAH box helicase n=1 Tax=Parafrankia discariae TaxID=365528 RepID=UPI0003779C03|nr:type ISP restriction/modification enzyme [Parafrankia discariae]
MPTTIYDVLDQLRASSISETDKGAKFERLMKAYLKIDPVFADQFADVWLWSEYPDNNGQHDTGIDLVARDKDTGHDVAVQCKFFAPSTYVTKPMIDSFLAVSGHAKYGARIIISTSDKWNPNAEDAIKNQLIPVRRIGLADLEASRVDWSIFSLDKPDQMTLASQKAPRKHQQVAIEKIEAGFGEHDRGKMIMACGTGKTFTSLKIAERNVGAGGKVLFLVPSINLLSQTVREWIDNSELQIRALAVCSDAKSTARKKKDDAYEDISTIDFALPATTNILELKKRIKDAEAETNSMTVVFSTYQSIDVVAQAQQGLREFDLIVADEAHRTTGTTLAGENESTFVKVHNDAFLPAGKRLYMTATPRIYDDSSKTKAGDANAVLASMDDEELFGPEFHRLGFGEAVEQGLLADYKVLVLTVDEESVARTFQMQLSDDGNELKLDDAAKIVGCWNGLAKRGKLEHSFEPDARPMRRAIAFAGNIKDSKRIEDLFQAVTDYYVGATDQEQPDGSNPLKCTVQHVDGGMNALERNTKLDWLRAEPRDGVCRILTNARCLSEGIDVPALDAVMFLSPRKSVVDIVQSVGRVMRLDPNGEKKFGYIILPIGVPSGMTPEEGLKENKRYAVVWEILQALRAHDDRFDALVNRISLSKARDTKVNIIGVGGEKPWGDQGALDLVFPDLDQWRDSIYAKIVQKVGSREYWTDWAKDVASIAERQITRIAALLTDPQTGVRERFDEFLHGIRGNLNENVTEAEAVEMLAQHLITRPVFNALFAGDDFLNNNPVAQTMEKMLAVLDQHDLEAENESLHKFYDSVRRKVADVKDREGRQELVRRLYDTFFATAFKKTVDKLGIVYTPVQIVDFILRSADEVLKKEFGQSVSDEGVHILDGFTGTGTFIVRLLELGLIKPQDLFRKYAEELHANEILLLAYYIAAVNIETTYMGLKRDEFAGDEASAAVSTEVEYESFPGLILTDTFQSWEDDDRPDLKIFPENNERLERLKGLPITVIVGNPPYSAGQESANDDNQNEVYPSLDRQIESTYAARSNATSKRTLYDSYIRAIKWATLRISDRGVVVYVTNGRFLDSNSADGLRKTLIDEFSEIYVYNLRGNHRTAGEQTRKEGGKIFGGGSRTPVAITLLVKNPDKIGPATIHYADIGDYLSVEQKFDKIATAGSMFGLESIKITPNDHGDWLDQRQSDSSNFMTLSGEASSIFDLSSNGIVTNRDKWVYSSASDVVDKNVRRMLEAYSEAVRGAKIDDPARIKWSRGLRSRAERGEKIQWSPGKIRTAAYRPFTKQRLYFSAQVNEVPGRIRYIFPTPNTHNCAAVIVSPRIEASPAILAVKDLPDLSFYSYGAQVFPRWRYEEAGMLNMAVGDEEVIDGYRKIDNISDHALGRFQAAYGPKISKDEIFFYVYGLLHSPEYRETYAADLKKILPRIPLVMDPWPFVEAGRELSKIHLEYESVTPYPLDGLEVEPVGDPYEFFAVQKMTFKKKRDPETKKLVEDKTSIVYNSRITLGGIPEDAHRYMLGSRSAIEWIIDRYRVDEDKGKSGNVNDPNDWGREVRNPKYIVDLLARIVTVSLETMQIVDNLPAITVQ